MDRNEAIKQVEKITCLGRNRPRPGWAAGCTPINIDGTWYPTAHCFNSNRSACFKSVVQFLQDHNVPHFVQHVERAVSVVII